MAHGAAFLIARSRSLRSLDGATGRELWNCDLSRLVPASGPFQSNPSILLSSAGSIVLVGVSCGAASHLLAIDAATGHIRWDHDCSAATMNQLSDNSGPILSPPVVWRDTVIFRVGIGLKCLRLIDGKEIWDVPFDPLGSVPLTQSGRPETDGTAIYFNSDFGIAYAFDPRDGHKLWSAPTDAISVEGTSSIRNVQITFTLCAPLLTGGILVIADGLGNIYGLQASTGTTIWRAHPGYTFQFARSASGIYAATTTGLHRLDARTGEIMRSRERPEGNTHCVFTRDMTVTADVPSGWEILGSPMTKSLWTDPSFEVRNGMTLSGDTLLVAGRPSEAAPLELRAYRLPAHKSAAH